MKLLPCLAALGLVVAATNALAQDQPPPLPPPSPPPPSNGTPTAPPPEPAPAVQPAQPAPAASSSGARSAPEPYSPEPSPEGAPLANTGFQMALRMGPMFPIGDAAKDTPMGDIYGWQVPLVVELGGKPIPNLFIGGYLGLGFGGAGGKQADLCDKANASCVAASFRLGVEIQYHFTPAEKTNPWIGYGIGLESVGVSGSSNGRTVSQYLSGPEWAHFMGGLDFRLSKTIGIGPLVDFAIGRYTHSKVETGNTTIEGDIKDDDRTTHFWLFIGGRLVIFP
jgi:hypothetical protein